MKSIVQSNVIFLKSDPDPQRKPKKPRNSTSDGRRCVRVDAGMDPATGKRIRKAFYGKTLKEAQAKADEYKRDMVGGIDVLSRDQPLSDWIDTWLDVYGRKGAPSTISAHESRAHHLAAALGQLKLSAVRPAHIQRYADSLAGFTSYTIRNYRNVVQAIFRQAVHNRLLAYDPTLGVIWSGEEDGSHRSLASAEIACITDHWQGHPMGATAMIMLYCGLRRGEALGLQWTDVDFDSGIIHIKHAMQVQSHCRLVLAGTKTRYSVRDIPMLPIVRMVLDSLPHSDDFVLPQYQSSGTFAYAFRQYVKDMAAYYPGLSFTAHDLRHTFASICYDAGVDVMTAQALLGHASPQTTLNIYTHLTNEHKATSVNALADFTQKHYGHQMGINKNR